MVCLLDGEIVSYSWDFGDGNTSTQESPGHTYSEDGTYLVSCTVTDNENVSSTSWRYITIYPTSVNTDITINDDAVQIYPNPNNGNFTVELNGLHNYNYDLEIVNLIGSVIFKEYGLRERKIRVDITDRSKGLYIVKIKQGANIFTRKVILY